VSTTPIPPLNFIHRLYLFFIRAAANERENLRAAKKGKEN